jgi:hypothetical protein
MMQQGAAVSTTKVQKNQAIGKRKLAGNGRNGDQDLTNKSRPEAVARSLDRYGSKNNASPLDHPHGRAAQQTNRQEQTREYAFSQQPADSRLQPASLKRFQGQQHKSSFNKRSALYRTEHADEMINEENGNIIALACGPLKKPRYINPKIEKELVEFKKEIEEKFEKCETRHYQFLRPSGSFLPLARRSQQPTEPRSERAHEMLYTYLNTHNNASKDSLKAPALSSKPHSKNASPSDYGSPVDRYRTNVP